MCGPTVTSWASPAEGTGDCFHLQCQTGLCSGERLTVVCFVFRRKADFVYFAFRRKADCCVLCVQEKGRMLTVVCFVFRRKAGGGSDKDADCGVLCVHGEKREATVTDEDADCGMLCVQGKSGRWQWRRCWQWCALSTWRPSPHRSHRPSLGHSYPATSLPVSKT